MNQQQFAERVRKFVNEQLPDLKTEKNKKEFALNIVQNGISEPFYLKNLFKEYQQSNFDEIVKKFVSILSALGNEQMNILNFNKDFIFPIVRSSSSFDTKDQDFILHKLTSDLSVCYALEFENHIRYVERNMLNDFFPEKELEKYALINVLKKGWLNHTKEEHSQAGKMLLFRRYEDEFAFQFFFQDMYEHYLGKDFYLILPTKNIAMVLIPNSIDKPSVMEGILKLKEFAVKLMSKEPHPISEKVYHISNALVIKIG